MGLFEKVRNEAEAKADYDVELDICGSDVDGRMIEVARANAEEVGLGDSITFKQLALKILQPRRIWCNGS